MKTVGNVVRLNAESVAVREDALGPKKTFDYQGRKVQGQTIEFDAKQESWNQYVLEDGTLLKMKIVLLDVVRLDEFNDNGEPIYQFAAHYITGTQIADESLKKKKQ